jgi:ubiquinone/menaquinone biosynthesis C-methylase UbiE
MMDINALKARMRDTWSAGDFGVIARHTSQVAEEFTGRLKFAPRTTVLDVACGTGNTSIPAARAGARVTGVDIAANLLEQARQRAAQEGLEIDFREGDAEQLAFPDASFDAVITMYGAMFAPRPERVAAEFLRVCRPGGMIAMANWTPGGFPARMLATVAKHAPPPHGLPAPVLWGDEATVRQRLGPGTEEIRLKREIAVMSFPFPPKEVVQLFRKYFGPTQVAFSRLDERGQAALAAEMEQLFVEYNQSRDGTTVVHGEYLEVVAVRAS